MTKQLLEYVELFSDLKLGDVKSENLIKEFRQDISLRIQGRPVMIFGQRPAVETAVIMAMAMKVASEVVLMSEEGGAVLVFTNLDDNYIRSVEIQGAVWNEIQTIMVGRVLPSSQTELRERLEIDVATLWVQSVGQNEVERVLQFAWLFQNSLSYCHNLVIQNEAPALALMVAIYLARPYGTEIQYKDVVGSSVTLFAE